jgi:thioredoxin-related protein
MQNSKLPGFLVFTLLFLFSVPNTYAQPPAGYDFLSYGDGLAKAGAQNKKIFVYFGRYGCGFCEKVNKESFSNKAVLDSYSSHYVLVYVDSEGTRRMRLPTGERITEMQLGERMNTLGTPVFFFLEPDGKEIFKVYGYQSAEALQLMDRYISGSHYVASSFAAFKKNQ